MKQYFNKWASLLALFGGGGAWALGLNTPEVIGTTLTVAASYSSIAFLAEKIFEEKIFMKTTNGNTYLIRAKKALKTLESMKLSGNLALEDGSLPMLNKSVQAELEKSNNIIRLLEKNLKSIDLAALNDEKHYLQRQASDRNNNDYKNALEAIDFQVNTASKLQTEHEKQLLKLQATALKLESLVVQVREVDNDLKTTGDFSDEKDQVMQMFENLQYVQNSLKEINDSSRKILQ